MKEQVGINNTPVLPALNPDPLRVETWVVNRFGNEDAWGPLRTLNHRVPSSWALTSASYQEIPGTHSSLFESVSKPRGFRIVGNLMCVWGRGRVMGLVPNQGGRSACLPSPRTLWTLLSLCSWQLKCSVLFHFFRTKLFGISSFIHSQP